MIPFASPLLVRAAAAAVVPTFTLDFIGAALPGGVSASGGANGKRVNAAALLVAAAAPRFDYSAAAAGSLRGLLVEPAATNLCLQSEAFDAAAWVRTDMSLTPNAVAAPDGTTTADTATEGSAGTAVVKQTIAITTGLGYWFSMYLKPAGTGWLRFQLGNGAGSQALVAWVDIIGRTVGTVATTGTPAVLGAMVEDAGGGWVRVALGVALPAGTSIICQFQSAVGNGSNTRVVGAVYSLWGAQFEQSAVATTYMGPVTTAAVTRGGDSVGLTVPAGTTRLAFGFDDGSSQQLTVATGAYTVPTSLARARLRTITGLA